MYKNLLKEVHSMNEKSVGDFKKTLCLGFQSTVELGIPVSLYTNPSNYMEFKNDKSVDMSKLPESLRIRENQFETCSPIFRNEWIPQHVMKQFVPGAPLTKRLKTGTMNGFIYTKDSLFAHQAYPVSIFKYEIISDDLWRSSIVPLENAVIKRKVKELIKNHNASNNNNNNDGSCELELTDQELSTLTEHIDHVKLRETLIPQFKNSPHNPAYINALVLLCGDYLRENKLSIAFPVYHGCARVNDYHFYTGITQSPYNPMSCVVTIHEQLGPSMHSIWKRRASENQLSGATILADVFQICFALASAQRHLGLVCNNLTTKKIYGRYEYTIDAKNDAEPYIFYSVNGKMYKVPSYGYVWKLADFGHASIVFNSQRLVSLEFQDIMEHAQLPYQRDLVSFAASAFHLVDTFLPNTDPLKTSIIQLFKSWLSCEAHDQINSGAKQVIDLMELETKVCGIQTEEDENNESNCSTANVIKSAPFDLECSNAIPLIQLTSPIFDMFNVIDKSLYETTQIIELQW